MIESGFMPKGRMPHRPHGSRDYFLQDVINCAASQCPVNVAGKCGMPSAIKIGADLKCRTGEQLIADKKPEPKKPIDGD